MQTNDWAHLARQWDFLQPLHLENAAATVVGCGAVGSVAAVALLKMGLPRVVVYDEDVINPENLPNQFLPAENGLFKTVGLESLCLLFGIEQNLVPYQQFWRGQPPLTPIVVSAADSMAVRRQLFASCVRTFGSVKLFIDVRTGGEYMKVYAVNPSNTIQRQWYMATLHPDDESDPTPCTASQIIYTSLMAGALVAHRVKQYLRQEPIEAGTIFDIQHERIVPCDGSRAWQPASQYVREAKT